MLALSVQIREQQPVSFVLQVLVAAPLSLKYYVPLAEQLLQPVEFAVEIRPEEIPLPALAAEFVLIQVLQQANFVLLLPLLVRQQRGFVLIVRRQARPVGFAAEIRQEELL